MPTRHYTVRGLVQGVGFRGYALQSAVDLHLHGEVWNTRDGSVEVVATAPAAQNLDKFHQALQAGPGRVDAIQAADGPDAVYESFLIGPTR